jgi:hypothetical protein
MREHGASLPCVPATVEEHGGVVARQLAVRDTKAAAGTLRLSFSTRAATEDRMPGSEDL